MVTYNRVCPGCSKRWTGEVNNSDGWIDIERCPRCAAKGSRRLQNASEDNKRKRASRLRIAARKSQCAELSQHLFCGYRPLSQHLGRP
jgi:hypothetical protein